MQGFKWETYSFLSGLLGGSFRAWLFEPIRLPAFFYSRSLSLCIAFLRILPSAACGPPSFFYSRSLPVFFGIPSCCTPQLCCDWSARTALFAIAPRKLRARRGKRPTPMQERLVLKQFARARRCLLRKRRACANCLNTCHPCMEVYRAFGNKVNTIINLSGSTQIRIK